MAVSIYVCEFARKWTNEVKNVAKIKLQNHNMRYI